MKSMMVALVGGNQVSPGSHHGVLLHWPPVEKLVSQDWGHIWTTLFAPGPTASVSPTSRASGLEGLTPATRAEGSCRPMAGTKCVPD
jgi:hypothetical protein